MQGLPADATPEQRAAHAAAVAAYTSVLPYVMPIYQPYGLPPVTPAAPQPGTSAVGNSGAATPAAAAGPGAAAHNAAVAAPGTESAAGPSQAAFGGEGGGADARAVAAASAAVAASIAAARQMLQGQVSVLTQQMEALDRVQTAIRPPQGDGRRGADGQSES